MENRRQFLGLFFKEGEQVCMSHNKFAHFSISQECALSETVDLTTSGNNQRTVAIDSSELCLCSLNPIVGSRCDANVTAFRSFLIELDDMPLKNQLEYVKREMNMPFSIAVFSGSKSIHFGIVLEKDLPSIEYWRFICQWILNIMEESDQQTKNPSRGIRVPGALRKEKERKQTLIEINDRISIGVLLDWLERFPDKKPKKAKKRDFDPSMVNYDEYKTIPVFVQEKVEAGIDSGRNQEWFNMACVLAKKMWEEEEVISYFGNYFTPENDFTEKEWLICISSAFKTVFK